MKRRRSEHEPTTRGERMARLVVGSLPKEHSRARLHAEVGPQPGGLAPFRFHGCRLEASGIGIRRAVLQLVAATFIGDPGRRQTLLEELNLNQRLRLLIQYLREENG